MGLTYQHQDSPGALFRKSGDNWEIAFAAGLAFVPILNRTTAAELDADLKSDKLTACPRKSSLRPDRCCDKWPFCHCAFRKEASDGALRPADGTV